MEKARKEKDEARRKLDAIYQLASPRGVKREGECVERFSSSQEVVGSSEVKREAEEGAEKRAGASFWNL